MGELMNQTTFTLPKVGDVIEGKNQINMKSKHLSIIGILFFTLLIILLSLISLNTLGITL